MNGRANHILSEVEVDVVLVLVVGEEHLVPRGGEDILTRVPGPAARPRALGHAHLDLAFSRCSWGGGGGEGGGFECAAYAVVRGGDRVGRG